MYVRYETHGRREGGRRGRRARHTRRERMTDPDRPDLAVQLPSDARATLAEWLWGTSKRQPLVAEAKLMPLLSDLPPPAVRAKRLAPLDEAALRAFELQPLAPAPGSAESSGPVDMRRRIWELSHQVHEVYTNQWPHTWARPEFAKDEKNPSQEVWAPWAGELLKFDGLKKKLESWRDAPETAPKTKEALVELIEKLGKFATRMRKKRDAEHAATQQQQAADHAARSSALAAEERTLEAEMLQQQHFVKIKTLQEELTALQGARKMDMSAVTAKMSELTKANASALAEQTELRRRHAEAASQEQGHAASAEPAGASAAAGGAGGPRKRQRK